MLGYTRHVSIKFANHPDGATAEFVICRAEAQPSAGGSRNAGRGNRDDRFARNGIQLRRTAAKWKAYGRNSAGRHGNPTGFGARKITKQISGGVVLLAMFCAATAINAQSMFRGDAMHSGTYAGPAPRQFHRRGWKFPTGDRVISSAVFMGILPRRTERRLPSAPTNWIVRRPSLDEEMLAMRSLLR